MVSWVQERGVPGPGVGKEQAGRVHVSSGTRMSSKHLLLKEAHRISPKFPPNSPEAGRNSLAIFM